ncbi:MAG: hypothetical protein RIS18_174 [Actinomycetota bacterium]|jgi:hypothetical protein
MFNRKKIKHLEEQLVQLQNKFEEEIYYTSKAANPLFGKRVYELKKLLNLYALDQEIKWFGTHGDGGYLLIDDLSDSDTLISGGIGDNDSFEREIAPYIKQIQMFDHTIKNYKVPASNSKFHQLKISEHNGLNEISIEKIATDNPSEDYLLKLDIEGDEWAVLDSLETVFLDKFRQIIVEFHYFNRGIQFDFPRIVRVLEKLMTNHSPFSIHANNHGKYMYFGDQSFPQTLEIGFARNRSYELRLEKEVSRHTLQHQNAEEYEEFLLW